MTEEEKAQMEVPFVGKNGTTRKLEVISLIALKALPPDNISQYILGRQKLKKSLQYEIKWRGLDHKFNTWIPRDQLIEKGFTKIVQQFDDLESSREGAGQRDTSAHIVRRHLEDIGLDGDIAQYNEISGLSGGQNSERNSSGWPYSPPILPVGQKIKLVIAACLWNNPQVLPFSYL